jgi:hypothetical protein
VYYAPVITDDPDSVYLNVNDQAAFSFAADAGNPSTFYKWEVNNGSAWSVIGGATTSSYNVTTSNAIKNYQYRCIVGNNSSFTLTASVNISGGTFIWSDSVQNVGSSGINYGNTNPLTIAPQDTTLYTLIYGLTYDNGQVVCYDTAQALINVYQKPYIDTIYDTVCSGVSFSINPANYPGNIIPNGTLLIVS